MSRDERSSTTYEYEGPIAPKHPYDRPEDYWDEGHPFTSRECFEWGDDMVNSPNHYQSKLGIECIDVIEDRFPNNYHLGNALKYLWRCQEKGRMRQDIQKAIWYLQRWVDKDLSQEGEDYIEKEGK